MINFSTVARSKCYLELLHHSILPVPVLEGVDQFLPLLPDLHHHGDLLLAEAKGSYFIHQDLPRLREEVRNEKI